MKWHNRRMIRIRTALRWCIIAGLIALLAACGGDEIVVSSGDNEEMTDEELEQTEQGLKDWWDEQEVIVAPWTTVLENATVESATIESDRLIFTADARETVESLGELDIVVSGHHETPFLRRIVNIEDDGENLVFITEHAGLNEAILKATIIIDSTTAPFAEDIDSSEGSLRQLMNSNSTALASESFSLKDVLGTALENMPDFDFDATPRFDAYGGIDVVLEIESNWWAQNFGVYTAEGTRSCQYSSQCFGDEHCASSGKCAFNGSSWNWPFPQTKCQEIVGLMELAEKSPGCLNSWESWWNGAGDSFRQCENTEASWYQSSYIYAPHPAQIEWAQGNCSGTVKEFKTEFEQHIQVSIDDLSFTISDDFEHEFADSRHTFNTPTKVIMAGYVPIVFRIEPSIKFNLEGEVSGSVEWATSDPMQVTAGFNAGVRYDRDLPGDNKWRFNSPGNNPNFDVSGFSGSDQSIVQTATAEGRLDLTVSPRLMIVFYELAGPYIEPFEVNTGLDLDLRHTTDPSPGENYCSLGSRTEASILTLGLDSALPFDIPGQDVLTQAWTWKERCDDSFDYCGDLPSDFFPPCIGQCIFGCGESGIPTRVQLRTENFGQSPRSGQNDPFGYPIDRIRVQREIGTSLEPEHYYAKDIIEKDSGTAGISGDAMDRLNTDFSRMCVPPDEWENEGAVVFQNNITVSFEDGFEFRAGDELQIGRPSFEPGQTCENTGSSTCEYEGHPCQNSGEADVYIVDADDNEQLVFEGYFGENQAIWITESHVQ